jgi:serine/threonine protein kinase
LSDDSVQEIKFPMNPCPHLTHTHAHLNAELQRCLEALLNGKCNEAEFVDSVRGKCSENEFIDAIDVQLRTVPASRPQVVAVINRLRSRDEMPRDLVRFLESKIAVVQLPNGNDDITIDVKRNGVVTSSHAVLVGPLPSPVEVGDVLRNRYVIEKRLGSGGKGTVFKALDRYRSSLPPPQRYVALKVLHPVVDGRNVMGELLQRELYCAQMLSHRNIVNVFELDRDGDIDFFTMELLEGELLSSVMARFQARPMHRPHAWAIIRQIAAGLAYAHSREVVHADLKPQNIMITDSGEVRILDFGSSSFSKQASDGREQNVRSATPAYASCEILEGRQPDPRDDLYAFACISYELLTGMHPFQRRRANEARDLGIVATRPPGLSRRQWQTLAKGLYSHRAGRSISVCDWFNRLKVDREEAKHLPSSKNLEPAHAHANTSAASSLRSSALLALLAVTVAAWVLFVRLAPGGKVNGEALPSVAASVVPLAVPLASSTTGASNPISGSSASPAPVMQSQPLSKMRSDGSRTKSPFQMNHPVAVSATDYEVRPGERFAEIRVRRSSGQRDAVPFVWWTEAASAKPGIDYVPQAKVTQSFPKGKSSISFFVKLLPKASRIRPEVFYVAIGDAAGGPSLGKIVHTAVWLPSNDGAEAAHTPQTANVANSAFGTQ